MRAILLLFLSLIILKAENLFWKELYGLKVKNLQESNSSDYIDKSVDFYNEMIIKIKQSPQNAQVEADKVFDKKVSFKEILLLKERIKTNQQRNNDLAVARDEIALDTLYLQEKIYNFILLLTRYTHSFDTENMAKLINSEVNVLQKFDTARYQETLLKINNATFPVALDTKQNYAELEMVYDFYKNFLHYLEDNQKELLHREYVFSLLALNNVINVINSQESAILFNEKLSMIKLDAGRLLLFMLIVLFFFSLKTIGDYGIFPYLKKRLRRRSDYIAEILLTYFEHWRKPLSYLVRLFGADLAVQILYYPSEMHHTLDVLFYGLYAILIVWLLFALINVGLEIFLQTKYKQKREIRKELLNLTVNIFKVTILIIALLLFLRKNGIDITGFIASLGLGGLAIALAAKDTISNFFASVKMIFEEPFHQGDWIETDEFEGFVVELGFTCTKIRTFDNALVTVPNAKLANTSIRNWKKRIVGRRIKFFVRLPYHSKKESVEKAIIEVREMLMQHPDIVTDEKIQNFIEADRLSQNSLFCVEDKYGVRKTLLVHLDALSPYSMDILIYAFSVTINWEEWLNVKQDVIMKIWDILEANELEFAIPSQTIQFEKVKKTKS